MNVLIIGGSKNIGYYAAQRLLANNATVTFLLRNKASFDNDEGMKPYIASGKARIVEGDALKETDVQRAWDAAANAKDGHVDIMLFTVGGTPKFHLTKGFVLDPADLCTRCMLNVLRTMPLTSPQPKIILVSSTGLTKSSHASLPLALKPMYAYLIASPHLDKLGMERAIAHSAGWKWEDGEPEPDKSILPDGWTDRLPEPGTLKSVLVLRPALFTDGKCKADELKAKGEDGKGKAYRVSEQDLSGSYTISRRDVAQSRISLWRMRLRIGMLGRGNVYAWLTECNFRRLSTSSHNVLFFLPVNLRVLSRIRVILVCFSFMVLYA